MRILQQWAVLSDSQVSSKATLKPSRF